MERFANAYARALFPRGAKVDATSAGQTAAAEGTRLSLTADGLDVAIGASTYRIVNAIEGWLDALRQRRRPSTAPAGRVSTAPRVGCG